MHQFDPGLVLEGGPQRLPMQGPHLTHVQGQTGQMGHGWNSFPRRGLRRCWRLCR